MRLRAELDEAHRLFALDHVVDELGAGHYKSGAAADLIGGLIAHIQSWCEAAEVPYEGFSPSEIKRHATGNGNAPKDDVFRAARARWARRLLTIRTRPTPYGSCILPLTARPKHRG